MPKDFWDKAKIFSSALVPIVVALVGYNYNNALKEKEIIQKEKEFSLKNIEVAVGILTASPSKENQDLREWAINTVNKYSEIKMSTAVKKLLKEKPLPKPVYKENPVTIIDGGGAAITDEKGTPLVVDKILPAPNKP
ncbi:hypothetical protein [Geomonas subterranea]|uniref:hypothetical protein n=1 Tax=Geomonas subterranea TaxID=2847989 RepID=UPI001CD26579|nr:hypothetical protein [Geomonas fuzhouensis]